MTQAENIIRKLIDERAITGEEAMILLKALYGKETSYVSVTPNESTISIRNLDTIEDKSITVTTY